MAKNVIPRLIESIDENTLNKYKFADIILAEIILADHVVNFALTLTTYIYGFLIEHPFTKEDFNDVD